MTVRNDGGQGAPAGSPNLWDFLGQMGFPPPQQLLTEVQRLNASLERMAPDIHRLAGASASISELAAAIQRIGPEDVRQLTSALKEASQTGQKLQQRLWPGG